MKRNFFSSGIAVVLLGLLSIAGNSQTASAQTVDSATMTVGHSGLYFGYSNGTSIGTFGALSSTSLTGGYTVKMFEDTVNPFALGSASVQVSGFSANPGSTWLVYASANGVTLGNATASYSYSGGAATWTWVTSSGPTPFGLWAISGGTTTTALAHF